MFMCKYLQNILKDSVVDPNNYYDALACWDTEDKCPKKKLRHKISAHCWRFK